MQPLPQKTEVFESFEVLQEREEEAISKKPNPNVQRNPAPSLDFMDELKQKLATRTKVLNKEDPLVYKEYNSQLKKFVEITKEEREVKASKRDLKIKEIEQK